VVTAASPANAASILPSLDGEDPSNPPAIKWLDPGETAILRFYLDLEGEEMASIFEADFDFLMSGSWDVVLDLFEVEPGPCPPCVGGTWPIAVGSLTLTQAIISLASNNLGGERLVARLDITRQSDTPDDFFEVSLGEGTLVAMDIPDFPYVLPIPLACEGMPCAGIRLFATPEPNTAFLLAAGLMGLAAVGRQRDAWARRSPCPAARPEEKTQ
jgi:hypothetical protein